METFSIEGIIEFKNIESGFWAMIDNNNKKWRFVNLPSELQKNGLSTKLNVKLVDEAVSLIMWGKAVEVIK
jgi:hypothetical protein